MESEVILIVIQIFKSQFYKLNVLWCSKQSKQEKNISVSYLYVWNYCGNYLKITFMSLNQKTLQNI